MSDSAAPGDDSKQLEVSGELPHTSVSIFLDGIIRKIGEWVSWLWGVLVLVIVVNVTLRYVFGEGRVELEELQWHLYAVGFMIGLSYCAIYDSHVRVDVFHARFRPRTKAWVELFGLLFFLIPFVVMVARYAWPFAVRAFEIGETSDAPGGLPERWIVKSFLLIGFVLLGVTAISRLTRATSALFGFPRASQRRPEE